MSTSKHLFRWHSTSKNLADEFTRCHAWKINKFRNMSCSPPGELLTVLYCQKTHRCTRTEQLAISAFGCEGHSYHRQQLTPGILQFCVREDAHLQDLLT